VLPCRDVFVSEVETAGRLSHTIKEITREEPDRISIASRSDSSTNRLVRSTIMAEKRIINRVRRRLALRFGNDTPVRMAFTEDVTDYGMFIKTTNLYRPGTQIAIELILPDERKVNLIGMVRWSKKVPPNMIHLVKKAGMGVKILRFVDGEDTFMQFILGTQTNSVKASEQPAAAP
jgi:Tfp pilus assembly protein PilZ